MISAMIQSQPNSPAVASIQIPSNDYALQLKPRTLVHLFFYDFYQGQSPNTQVAGEELRRGSRTPRDPDLEGILPPARFEQSVENEIQDQENENYKLLFCGEVSGIQYTKQALDRGMILQCMDLSNYWDYTFQYQGGGGGLFGGGDVTAAFSNAGTRLFSPGLFGTGVTDTIRSMVLTKPRNYPELKGTLLASIVHIIEAVGGTYFGQRAIRGTNDFASLAEMRYHLTQMVGADPFPGSQPRLNFGGFFGSAIRGLGKKVSIRAILNVLAKYIWHESVPITSPRYIPPFYDPNLPPALRVSLEEDPATHDLATAATRIRARALELLRRQELSTTDAEAQEQSAVHGDLRSELRRLVVLCSQAASRARRVGVRAGVRQEFSFLYNAGAGVSEAFAVSADRFNQMTFLTRRGQRSTRANTLLSPSTAEGRRMQILLQGVADDMQRVLETTHLRRPMDTGGQPDKPQRLMSQIWRPDVWMVAPPRCNIIFPELYAGFSYAREFMQETSRLLLKTSGGFLSGGLFGNNHYVAPSGVMTARRGEQFRNSRRVFKDFMDHELYTGILPQFERMTEANLRAIRGGTIEIDNVRFNIAQVAANHLLFKYRFASRQLQVQGKFNPFLALGFPALVVDSYLDEDTLRTGEYESAVAARLAEAAADGEAVGRQGLPGDVEAQNREIVEVSRHRFDAIVESVVRARPNLNYFGTPTMIQHTISASGQGNTSTQMGYARSTNERTEFLGADQRLRDSGRGVERGRRGFERTRRTRNQPIRTVVAMFSSTAPEIGARGPRGGEITAIEEVTARYTPRSQRTSSRSSGNPGVPQTRFVGGRQIPLWVPGGVTAGRVRRGRNSPFGLVGSQVYVGVEQEATQFGTEVTALAGARGDEPTTRATTLLSFKAWRITEAVGVWRRELVDLPAEDLVFPPWFGEHYRSNNIGGLYQYFFGTGSIVDPLAVIEPLPQMPENTEPTEAETSEAGNMPPPGIAEPPSGISPDEVTGPSGEPMAPLDSGAIIHGEITARSKLEQSVEEVVRTYSRIRTMGFDVNEFIRNYTWRPIATMVDMFGTSNLVIDDDGRAIRGVEGFHSRAFGDYDDLRALVRDDGDGRPQTILGLTITDPHDASSAREEIRAGRSARISAALDTRKEKRQAVYAYLTSLMASRGIVG